MAQSGVSNTALGAATCRLIEQYQPPDTRLFNDPFVTSLVGTSILLVVKIPAMRKFIIQQTDQMAPGIFGAQICRTRYIDDAVQAELAKGIDQMVILGAGYDTRAYRLPEVGRIKILEVDLAAVQEDKKKKLQKRLGMLPENVTFIPIDFDRQTLEDVLTHGGEGSAVFDPGRPAVFIWEGVTQYISEESVRQTFAFVGKTAPGSIIIFTYVLRSVIERRSTIPGARKMMDYIENNNAAWIFGLDPETIAGYLKPFHLELFADVGNSDYQATYLRPLQRNLTVSEIERIAQARVVLA